MFLNFRYSDLSELDITRLLSDYQSGNEEAINDLFPAVYQELHAIANRQLRKSWSVETICATVLINESYLKLIQGQQVDFTDRAHFFAIAATAMRQIILNYAAQKQTAKRGADWKRVTVEEALLVDEHHADTLLSIGLALEQVASIDEQLAHLVEMRFFAGMTETEIASVQGVSDRTVRRNWIKAKALLMQALAP